MRKKIRQSAKSLYKGRYFLAFYDKSDEELLYIFNNIEEILKYKKEEINYYNKNITGVKLCRALKNQGNFTRMIDGSLMRVYIIDTEGSDEELIEKENRK